VSKQNLVWCWRGGGGGGSGGGSGGGGGGGGGGGVGNFFCLSFFCSMIRGISY